MSKPDQLGAPEMWLFQPKRKKTYLKKQSPKFDHVIYHLVLKTSKVIYFKLNDQNINAAKNVNMYFQ